MTPVREEAVRYLKLIGNGATQFTFQTFDDDQIARTKAKLTRVC